MSDELTGCKCEQAKPGVDPTKPREVAIAADNWKLKRFRRELDQLPYKRKESPFTDGTTVITVFEVPVERMHKDIHQLLTRLERELRSRN